MWIRWNVVVCETCFCEKNLADFPVSRVFQNYFNFATMLESRNVDHGKSNCSWDMFFWKNPGRIHIFISFSKYFNFVPMLESRNMEHVKSICSWDMFLWKDSGVLHSFTSFLKIFQFCTYTKIMKCGSREKYLFVRYVFVKKLLSDFKASWIFQKYFNFVPMLESRNVDLGKSICSWVMFLSKLQAEFPVS